MHFRRIQRYRKYSSVGVITSIYIGFFFQIYPKIIYEFSFKMLETIHLLYFTCIESSRGSISIWKFIKEIALRQICIGTGKSIIKIFFIVNIDSTFTLYSNYMVDYLYRYSGLYIRNIHHP